MKFNENDDDFVMTIGSDDEISINDEDMSDVEQEEIKKGSSNQAIITKKQSKQSKKKSKEKFKNETQLVANFTFEDSFDGKISTKTNGCSWDFTNAIEKMTQNDLARGMKSRGSILQDLIEKKRMERIEKKMKKKENHLKKENEKKHCTMKRDEEGEKEESNNTDITESDKDEDEDDNDSGNEENESRSESIKEESSISNSSNETSEEDDDDDDDEEEDNDDDDDEEDNDDDEERIEEEERLQQALENEKNLTCEELEEKKRADAFFDQDPFEYDTKSIETFSDLALSRPLQRAIGALGFVQPTPIQKRAIPIALTGKDICASAQTGSGKTAAFLLPILERLYCHPSRKRAIRVLIICPVRELATQCHSVLQQLTQFMSDISSVLVVGGLPLKQQEIALQKQPDVVICTPGRMIDHLRNTRSVQMESLEILVLDEADRLLEMGFVEEVQELVQMCSKSRQTMLFSATMTSKVEQLIQLSMKRPIRLSTDPLYDLNKQLIQEFIRIRPQREKDREAILLALCTRTFQTNTIVFLQYKSHCHRLRLLFGLAGLKVAELHGNLTQRERLESLQNFRDNKVDILLCTDVAARGIDIHGVNAVINYEMPKDLTTYVHRVGRTARAGRNGRAVTLTSENRRLLVKQITRHGHGTARSRCIPSDVIDQWSKRIESMEDDLKQIMKEEKIEKQLQEAEREALRAQNLVTYRDEIQSRPIRTWFQSTKEKKEIKERALTHQLEKEEKEEKKRKDIENLEDKRIHKLTRKKRRRLEIRQAEEKERTENLEEIENKKSKRRLTENEIPNIARKTKRDRILEARQKNNLSIAEIQSLKAKKEEKRILRKALKQEQKSNFDQDLTEKQSISSIKKLANGKNSASKEFEFKEKISNLRKGGKIGHQSFKSKGRYKRRK